MYQEQQSHISFRMKKVLSASTKPEMLLRHILWHLGFRYKVNDRRLIGKPDIVLPKYRTVIFVHGCFWHGHKDCKYYTVPKTNTAFWMEKVVRNQERDQEVWRRLEAMGWAVIVVWECQLKKVALNETVARVVDEIKRNGEMYQKILADRKASQEIYRQEIKIKRAKVVSLKRELKQSR